METTKPKEMFHEDIKKAEKAFKEANEHTENIYQNQFNAVSGFYSNVFKAMMPSHKPWSLDQRFLGMHGNNANQVDINNKNKEMAESHLEVSKNILKSSLEIYKKHLDANIESNIKMMEHVRSQFNSVINQTHNLWAEILNTNKAPLTEEDAYDKDSHLNANKKRADTSANGSTNHKDK